MDLRVRRKADPLSKYMGCNQTLQRTETFPNEHTSGQFQQAEIPWRKKLSSS
jgi:hypothetical protein